jgi:hypothetical protein
MLADVYRRMTLLTLCALLACAGPAAAAQQTGQPTGGPASSSSSATADPEAVALARARPGDQISTLLPQLAAGAKQIADPDVRLSAQLEVAALLWPRDPEQARRVYADVFDCLTRDAFASAEQKATALERLSCLLRHAARRDAALAERFADRMSPLLAGEASGGAARASYRAEVLTKAALEMLPRDPGRAAALGRLALADGVTASLVHLLVVLHGVDAPRADTLFGAALVGFLQNPRPRLSEVGTLALYLVATSGDGPIGVAPDVMRTYLDVAFSLIARTPSDPAQAASAYFVGRQLASFYPVYLRERGLELEARIAVLAQSEGMLGAERVAAVWARRPDSPDTAHALAAMVAHARDDEATAAAETAAIQDDSLRSRLVAQATLRFLRLGRFEEAGREIGRIPDPARRASLLVQVARAANARGESVRAVEALLEAANEAERAAAAAQRIQALFSIVSAWAEIDPVRAFETLQRAVNQLNDAVRSEEGRCPLSRPPALGSLDFDGAFGRLARIDFDGALLLARGLEGAAARVVAELAVCRGGWRRPGS